MTRRTRAKKSSLDAKTVRGAVNEDKLLEALMTNGIVEDLIRCYAAVFDHSDWMVNGESAAVARQQSSTTTLHL